MQASAALGRPALPLQLRRPLQTRQAVKLQRGMAVRASMAGAGAGDDPYQVRSRGVRACLLAGQGQDVECASSRAFVVTLPPLGREAPRLLPAAACRPPPP